MIQAKHEWVPANDGNWVYVGISNPDRNEYPGVLWSQTHGSKPWFPESVHNKIINYSHLPFLIKSVQNSVKGFE